MAEERECPMCGGTMRLKRVASTVQVRGNPQPTPQTTAEWVCPDCDYFEDAETEG
jgi:hypothetical protein